MGQQVGERREELISPRVEHVDQAAELCDALRGHQARAIAPGEFLVQRHQSGSGESRLFEPSKHAGEHGEVSSASLDVGQHSIDGTVEPTGEDRLDEQHHAEGQRAVVLKEPAEFGFWLTAAS